MTRADRYERFALRFSLYSQAIHSKLLATSEEAHQIEPITISKTRDRQLSIMEVNEKFVAILEEQGTTYAGSVELTWDEVRKIASLEPKS